jgi:hypothetical protein
LIFPYLPLLSSMPCYLVICTLTLHVINKLLVLFNILPSPYMICAMMWIKCVNLCMLLLQLVRQLSSVFCTMYRPQFSLVYTSIVVTLYLFVVSLMLIRLTMLMIKSLRVGILCFLVLPLSRGNQRNNIPLIVLLSKLSTRL